MVLHYLYTYFCNGAGTVLKIVSAAVVTMILLIGCDDSPTEPSRDCSCGSDPRKVIDAVDLAWSFYLPAVSRDFNHFAFTTIDYEQIVVQSIDSSSIQRYDLALFTHNGSQARACFSIAWSPLNTFNLLVVGQFTNADNRNYRRLFVIDVLQSKVTDVTPREFGDTTMFPLRIQWSPRSTVTVSKLLFSGYPVTTLDTSHRFPSLFEIESQALWYQPGGVDVWETATGEIVQDRRVYPPSVTIDGASIDEFKTELLSVSVTPTSNRFVSVPLVAPGDIQCVYESKGVLAHRSPQGTIEVSRIQPFRDHCIIPIGEGYLMMVSDTTYSIVGRLPTSAGPSLFLLSVSGDLIREVKLRL